MTEQTPVPQPTPAPAYAAGTPGAPVPPAPGADYPGKTLGIVGVVLSILGFFSGGFLSIVGLILGAVANGQSKAAGLKNGPAKVAIILGVISLVLGLILFIVAIAVAIPFFTQLAATCAELGPGVHEVNGVTYTCS